ncbi:N5-glutamine methyltransferase family protein [Pelagibacterium sp. 26DY04]|uniref:N5-glutamine methyltransferase family protein n=1 Tax=Pelagibacterium sp. 26DY04 TaxID=2967130 RepID=UPI0035C0C0AE
MSMGGEKREQSRAMSTGAVATTLFLGLEFEASGAVLRPRTETELLAMEALSRLDEESGDLSIIDMCCGAGNLAAAIQVNRPNARVWACDLTDGAIEATRSNIGRLGLGQKVSACQGDLFAALDGLTLEGSIDMIIANPPYISTKRLTQGDRAYLLSKEPREAFDGGPYGIALHQRILADAPTFLKAGGWLGLEFGLGQARQIFALIKRSKVWSDPQWAHDADGQERVVFIQLIARGRG